MRHHSRRDREPRHEYDAGSRGADRHDHAMRGARESAGPHHTDHQQHHIEIVDGVAVDPEQPSHRAGAGRVENLLRHEIALLGMQIANRVLVGDDR